MFTSRFNTKKSAFRPQDVPACFSHVSWSQQLLFPSVMYGEASDTKHFHVVSIEIVAFKSLNKKRRFNAKFMSIFETRFLTKFHILLLQKLNLELTMHYLLQNIVCLF